MGRVLDPSTIVPIHRSEFFLFVTTPYAITSPLRDYNIDLRNLMLIPFARKYVSSYEHPQLVPFRRK